MKTIIITIVFTIAVNALFAQTYNMKIKHGTGATYSVTSTVDEINFLNTTTTPFVCGDVILYGGETYPTVLIGTQCWFQKNLNIGIRIDGSSNQTDNSTIEKYCYGDIDANCTTYGGLYQWDETMQYVTPEGVQGICPSGWHLPTTTDIETLGDEVCDRIHEYMFSGGNALKAIGQGTGDGIGTNTSGFAMLLAGGHFTQSGDIITLGYGAYFWSSTVYNDLYAYYMYVYSNNDYLKLSYTTKVYGYSVRCLKD